MNIQQASHHLTDLEGAALAAIARKGSATRYQVAAEFAASPSEFWSGSAGAVYPMIQRLLDRGLLEAEGGADGRRQKTVFSLTRQGSIALRAWLLDAQRAAGLGFDPLRTRIANLGLVSLEDQQRFLAEVTAQVVDAPAFGSDDFRNRVHSSWITARKAWLHALQGMEWEQLDRDDNGPLDSFTP